MYHIFNSIPRSYEFSYLCRTIEFSWISGNVVSREIYERVEMIIRKQRVILEIYNWVCHVNDFLDESENTEPSELLERNCDWTS